MNENRHKLVHIQLDQPCNHIICKAMFALLLHFHRYWGTSDVNESHGSRGILNRPILAVIDHSKNGWFDIVIYIYLYISVLCSLRQQQAETKIVTVNFDLGLLLRANRMHLIYPFLCKVDISFQLTVVSFYKDQYTRAQFLSQNTKVFVANSESALGTWT